MPYWNRGKMTTDLQSTPALLLCWLQFPVHSPQLQLCLQPLVETQRILKRGAQSPVSSGVCCGKSNEKLVVQLKPTPVRDVSKQKLAQEHGTSVAARYAPVQAAHAIRLFVGRKSVATPCCPRHPLRHALLRRRAPTLSSPPRASRAPRLEEPFVDCAVSRHAVAACVTRYSHS